MLIVYAFSHAALGQQDTDKSQSADDVLRINTELVQTGVTVFDKQGRFVDGLKKEDFELRVDDRPVAISFFENIVAGSQRDRLARATGKNESMAVKDPIPALSFRQRTIVQDRGAARRQCELAAFVARFLRARSKIPMVKIHA